MIRMLEKFEDTFPDLDDTREGQIFKGDIRNVFNDAMRAQRDELRDYDVEYRPLQLTADNTLAMTQTFMKSVQRVEFGFGEAKPYLMMFADADHRKVLDALRLEFGAGVVHEDGESLVLEIVGTQSCVDCVLPIMDRYRLHSSVLSDYRAWRDQVVKLYRS